jgi:hypothetical protein
MTDPVPSQRGEQIILEMPEIIIHEEKAKKYWATVELSIKKGIEKKYNIKLLRQDYDVIKQAAEAEGRSASYFVSFLIYDHIARELAEMGEDSEDALILMAASADATTDYDIMSTPWVYDMMSEYIDEIVASVTRPESSEPSRLMEMVEKYKRKNSHHHSVVMLMLEPRHGA